jgi:hypothetical protein
MARSGSRTASNRSRRARPPLWLVEGLDIVRLRKGVLGAVVGAVVAAGIAMAILFPAIVPPVPIVGVAVAVAAILLGLAVAISVDAADLTIRGPRHVAAAGAELVAILPEHGDETDAEDLANAVLDARAEEDRKLLLGLASCGLDVRATVEWTDVIGLAIAHRDASVLRVDLASGRTPEPGLYEVHHGERRLNEVVDFEPDLRLARTGAGSDQAGALTTLPALHERLPRDLDVLLVAMPAAASRPVVVAARSLDHVLLVVERDATSRVDLIAALDALESAGAHAQVVLLDTPTAAVYRRVPAPVVEPEPAGDLVAEEPVPPPEPAHSAPEPAATPPGSAVAAPEHEVAAPEPAATGLGPEVRTPEPEVPASEDEGAEPPPEVEEEPRAEAPDDVTVTEVDESVSSADVEPGDGTVSSYAPLHDDDLVGAFDPYVPDASDDDAARPWAPPAEPEPPAAQAPSGPPRPSAVEPPWTSPPPATPPPPAPLQPPAAPQPPTAAEPPASPQPPAVTGRPSGAEPPATDAAPPGQDADRPEVTRADDERGPLPPRDVDVVLGAAAASAQVEVETAPPEVDDLRIVEDEDADTHAGEVPDRFPGQVADEVEDAREVGTPEPVPAARDRDRGHAPSWPPDEIATDPHEDDDPTDELPRQPRPAPLRGPDPEDDDIQTTAYLVALMRDIEGRGRRS